MRMKLPPRDPACGWYLLMLVIIVSVDFLLKLVGTESTLKRDVDFDHKPDVPVGRLIRFANVTSSFILKVHAMIM